jgi:hypothetical protein
MMAEERHFMNPAHGRHITGSNEEGEGKRGKKKPGEHPSIHIHSHSKGHTVHILHPSGAHEEHEFSRGDSEGISNLIHHHLGGEPGQDHGFSSGPEEEDEYGLGGPGV